MTAYDRWDDTPHGNPPSATETVAKLRLALNHLSLAELVEQGVVKWDKNSNIVRKGPRFNEKETKVMNMSADMSEIIIGKIIEAVSEVERTNSESMDMCLYRDVSTEAIQKLVAHESNAWRLQFETENHVVEVTGNDTIIVDGERM